MSTQHSVLSCLASVQIYPLVEINYDNKSAIISVQFVFLITHMFDCLASSAVSPEAALGSCLLTNDCWTSLSSDWKSKQLEVKRSLTVHNTVNLQTGGGNGYPVTRLEIGWMLGDPGTCSKIGWMPEDPLKNWMNPWVPRNLFKNWMDIGDPGAH